MKIETSTKVDKTNTINLNSDDIIGLLIEKGYAIKNGGVTFTVPGGADWSNTEIDIDDSYPITVTWKESYEE